MITYYNPLGGVSLTNEYFAGLVGEAAQHCYGVAGMASSSASVPGSVKNKEAGYHHLFCRKSGEQRHCCLPGSQAGRDKDRSQAPSHDCREAF